MGRWRRASERDDVTRTPHPRNFAYDFYSDVLLVRPPAPVTLNKAGANYKSEVTHDEYSPRQAYQEWLNICEGIVHFGGDALFDFEPDDDVFLDHDELHIDATGAIRSAPRDTVVGHVDSVLTGRVFTANGPWVRVDDGALHALFPNMLTHRVAELAYYERMLHEIARAGGLRTEFVRNPFRWEGLADVAVMPDYVILTHTVAGHYDRGHEPKTLRTDVRGAQAAATFAQLPHAAQVMVELVYPHFHGDTVHFVARGTHGASLFHYAEGIWPGDRARIQHLPKSAIIPISQTDAVEHYAANSRQVGRGLLMAEGASDDFCQRVRDNGLEPYPIRLTELFGKAGGGPACATLYLPRSVHIPDDFRYRYSMQRQKAQQRLNRIARRVTVDPRYFADRSRG
jgi:hypothetical protein